MLRNIIETSDRQRHAVELLMLGTSWLGEARVIVVSKQRQAERGRERELRTMLRWGARQWQTLQADWEPVGGIEISYSDHEGELFIRNLGAYRVDRRAVRRAESEPSDD